MYKFDKPLFLLLVVGLASCASRVPVTATPLSPVVITNPPTSSGPGTPTVTPSATATDIPPTSTPDIQSLNDDELKSHVDQLAAGFLKSTKNPGLSIAVVLPDPGSGQLKAMLLNYGTISKGGGKSVDSETVYELGSITKLFTGILLAEAVNAGEVKLTDPIQAYLPTGIEAPAYKQIPISLVNLATHRSGLPRDSYADNFSDIYTWLNSFRLSIAPGSEYIYSNLGYEILGDILARKANSDYGTLVFHSVSQPLGLLDTRESLTGDQDARLAKGYGYDGSPMDYEPDSGAMSSAGYLHSTLKDMTRFLIENMQPDSVSLSSSLKLAQTMQSVGRNPGTGTALGWEIDRPGTPGERLWKGGATNGFSSYISFSKNDSSGFILLTNGQYIDKLALQMARLLNELH
jgi:D-alanyl-D-alanine-carboxypeptidase/D-alanyl-D-alanine-endopeptidase